MPEDKKPYIKLYHKDGREETKELESMPAEEFDHVKKDMITHGIFNGGIPMWYKEGTKEYMPLGDGEFTVIW
jgi:hypothetical protein